MQTENGQGRGIRLLKKGKKGIARILFSRIGLFLTLMLLQILFLVGLYYWFRELRPHLYSAMMLFAVIMVLYLLNSRRDPTAKITWLVLLMLFPVSGALLYFYVQQDIGHRALKNRFGQMVAMTKDAIPQPEGPLEGLMAENPGVASLARYITRSGCYPVYNHTDVMYFPVGEDKFSELLKQLEGAKHFIFLEYFIISEGLMWGEILEILIRKAKEGVDVRLLYDGTCELALLPHKYPKLLGELGIKCKVFAPVSPFISTHYNYRDHRKILVIDGHTAFNGGINLADEYINRIERFGHWKDTAVMVQGEAAKSFTLMFLQMWNIDVREPEFKEALNWPVLPREEAKGYVIPYGDCPLDDDRVGEMVYMDILNRALRYVHIMTPYLILDGELETALKYAAERGVEVALILPGIPDKRLPYALAKTHYASLLKSGVRIYEYTPGFVHAKVFVSDDREAVVGTINLDYRSLYHHFECATYMYEAGCIPQIEADFQSTMEKCRQVTEETVRKEKLRVKLTGALMKVAAPLL